MRILLLTTLFFITIFSELEAQTQYFELVIAPGRTVPLSDAEDLSSEFTLGIHTFYSYHFDSRFSIITGLSWHYNRIGGIRDYSPIFGCDTKDGELDPLNSYYELEKRTNYLTVPVELEYNLGNFGISFGGECAFILSDDNDVILNECGVIKADTDSELHNIEAESILFNLIAGAQMALGKNKNTRIKPRVKYSVNSVSTGPDFDYKFLTFELGIGYRVSLD